MACSPPAPSISSTSPTTTASSSSTPATRPIATPDAETTLDTTDIIKNRGIRPGSRRVSPFLVLDDALRSTPNPNPLKILRKKWGEGGYRRSPPEDSPQQP